MTLNTQGMLTLIVICVGKHPRFHHQTLKYSITKRHQTSTNPSHFETISTNWTANINLPSVKHCCSENFCSFAPGSHTTIFLDLLAVFVFTSSLSSLTSLPHRRLHLRCRLRLIAVFVPLPSTIHVSKKSMA
ncbi:hypothetical protein OUZ56_001147 [Daphnia magna]|uniref:Uncharacterized protein n=1 Tax=Daphnia magna TaxID=35525 RepID=A0ABR0A2G8_9CRUS|nr:hypothetical protein OUZ56_001147 [Daphnia magna]